MEKYDAEAYRRRLANDRYRPLYHFVVPVNWMNDPNGAIFWKGKYHLFYQHTPHATVPGPQHWGHAVSEDLVHWKDLPIALTPDPDGPDTQCYSGCAVDDDGVPTLIYYGVSGGICIATSDDEMIEWQKHPQNPVIAAPPEGTEREWRLHDPFVWKEDGTWYCISGAHVGQPRGIGSSKDAAFMFRSPDLVNWEYMRPLYEPGEESDCAVPDFFPLGDRHVLVFISHTRGAQYYVGRYENQVFTPELHGRFTSNTYPPRSGQIHTCGDLISPISWKCPNGRRVMIAWIAEGRTKEKQVASGWAGILSLPSVLSLLDDGSLGIEPLPELEVLRRDERRVSDLPIPPGVRVPLEGVAGECLEIAVELELGDAEEVGVTLRRAPDGSEETVVSYDHAQKRLELNVERSSVSPDVPKEARRPNNGAFELPDGEPLKLRIFIDRSVVEVFANGRLCLTKRIYPTRPDSLGVGFFARGGGAKARSVKAWQMAPIWP